MSNKELATNYILHILYLDYLRNWIIDHPAGNISSLEFVGMSPVCYDEWVNNEFEDIDKEDLNDYIREHLIV